MCLNSLLNNYISLIKKLQQFKCFGKISFSNR